MNHAPISVVIPTHNRARMVTRAVASALACCRDGDEVIVVDEGSQDETREVLEPFMTRIQYVRTAQGGAGKARNRGIDEATHDLVAFLDSDDEWMRGTLDVKRALMQARSDLVFCFSDFASRTVSGHVDRYALHFWHNDPRSWSEILGPTLAPGVIPATAGAQPPVFVGSLYAAEMNANYVFTSTLVVRRSAAGAAFRFAEDLPYYEDWECFGKLSSRGPAAFIACETAWQHRHDGPRVTDASVLDETRGRLCILQRVWGADPGFLRDHLHEFQRALHEARTKRARALIAAGRVAEARPMLTTGGHPMLRLAANLPGPVVKAAILARRAVRRLLRTS
jgi:glycosyltransferase involved in cell wall biosynthesis